MTDHSEAHPDGRSLAALWHLVSVTPDDTAAFRDLFVETTTEQDVRNIISKDRARCLVIAPVAVISMACLTLGLAAPSPVLVGTGSALYAMVAAVTVRLALAFDLDDPLDLVLAVGAGPVWPFALPVVVSTRCHELSLARFCAGDRDGLTVLREHLVRRVDATRRLSRPTRASR